MALKADAELIADRAMRISALIRLRQQAKVEIEDNPDLAVDVTPAIRQAWSTRIDALQAEIAEVVKAWGL